MKDEVKAILNQIKENSKYWSNNSREFERCFNIFDIDNKYEKEREQLYKAINMGFCKRIQESKEPQETIRLLEQEYIPNSNAIETLAYLAYMLNIEKSEQVSQKISSQKEEESVKNTIPLPEWKDENLQLETIKNIIAKQLDEKIGSILEEINSLKEIVKELQNKDTLPLNKASDRDNKIISDFNTWAGNPASKLPSNFYYVSGNMQVRTEQHIIESPAETKWITNKEGTKYLFPNPNTLDQMTDISKLYKMDQEKLKAKGQNRIKVTKPCEMSDEGYINYPGELELL